MSLHCREDTSFSENQFNFSSAISINAEGEHPCFSSTPLHDSSDHEDVDEHVKFSNHGCHDLFTPSFNQDVDSFVVDLSKPLVFDDLFADEVETPQYVKALHPALMVMPSPHCLEVNSTSNKKSVETPQAPHHSHVYIEDQSSSQISLPPPESSDPIAHALEESYTTNTLLKRKFSSFFMFARHTRSKECTCLSSTHSVLQHHGTFAECLSCAFTLFFSVDTFKLQACWSTLSYLFCLLVYMLIFPVYHAFTNMGQPMPQWLHWKYHST